jgi:hypothetical protein
MSNDTDLQTDEDIVEGATREELLTSGALGRPREFAGMKLCIPTMETMSYLWELKNFFVFRDDQGRVVRNNPVVGIAEFLYVHHTDIDTVAEIVTDKKAFRAAIREIINGPLAVPGALEEAVPIIDRMQQEYLAAQAEIEATAGGKGALPGKGQARAGKRRISR